MTKSALDKKRFEILKKLGFLKNIGALAGGTALALQLGHRVSYDFDLFTSKKIPTNLLDIIDKKFGIAKPLLNTADELTITLPGEIKLSVIYFPFEPKKPFIKGYPLPLWSVTDIAGNKAYAIGRRGTYRDYVDIYATLKGGNTIGDIVSNAGDRFRETFNERLFLQQLVYLGDLNDFTIEWLWPKRSPKQVASFLEDEVKKYTQDFKPF